MWRAVRVIVVALKGPGAPTIARPRSPQLRSRHQSSSMPRRPRVDTGVSVRGLQSTGERRRLQKPELRLQRRRQLPPTTTTISRARSCSSLTPIHCETWFSLSSRRCRSRRAPRTPCRARRSTHLHSPQGRADIALSLSESLIEVQKEYLTHPGDSGLAHHAQHEGPSTALGLSLRWTLADLSIFDRNRWSSSSSSATPTRPRSSTMSRARPTRATSRRRLPSLRARTFKCQCRSSVIWSSDLSTDAQSPTTLSYEEIESTAAKL